MPESPQKGPEKAKRDLLPATTITPRAPAPPEGKKKEALGVLGAPGDTFPSSSPPQQSDWGGCWEEGGLHPQTATEIRWQLWSLDDWVGGERGAWSPVGGRLREACCQVTWSGPEQEQR